MVRFGIFVVAIATAKFHFEECEALKLSLKTKLDPDTQHPAQHMITNVDISLDASENDLGIGLDDNQISFTQNLQEMCVLVAYVDEKSEAQKKGVKQGDCIVAINGYNLVRGKLQSLEINAREGKQHGSQVHNKIHHKLKIYSGETIHSSIIAKEVSKREMHQVQKGAPPVFPPVSAVAPRAGEMSKAQAPVYDLIGPGDPHRGTLYSSYSPVAEAKTEHEQGHYSYHRMQSVQSLASDADENRSRNYDDVLFKSLESLFNKNENVDMYEDLNGEVKSLKNNVELHTWDGAPVWTKAVINGQYNPQNETYDKTYIHTLFAFSLNSKHKVRLFKFKIVHHSEVQMKNYDFNFHNSKKGPSGTMSFDSGRLVYDSYNSQQKKFNILYPIVKDA